MVTPITLSLCTSERCLTFFASVTEPELLILDEPTVGVDPIIRQSIWDHLVEITNTSKKTIIITTHYIEETRQAHIVSVLSAKHAKVNVITKCFRFRLD